MERPHGQRAFTSCHQGGEKFNLAISFLLPLKDKTGIEYITTIEISIFYVVTELIPLYLILMGITGSSIGTELNILPYLCYFLVLFLF